MQINNWFDLAFNTLFLSAVILIGLPISGYFLVKGIEGLNKHGLKKLPDGFLIASGLGSYSLQLILYSIFIVLGSVWMLFFDRGGQLGNLVRQAKSFLTGL